MNNIIIHQNILNKPKKYMEYSKNINEIIVKKYLIWYAKKNHYKLKQNAIYSSSNK